MNNSVSVATSDLLGFLAVLGTTTICVFMVAGAASLVAPPPYMDCHPFRRTLCFHPFIPLDLWRNAISLSST